MKTVRVAQIIGAIPSVTDVVLRELPPDNKSIEKGARTWNLPHPGGVTMIARRLKGEEVGNHFHARVRDKDPETFLLLRGMTRFSFKDLYGKVREVLMDADSCGPLLILIPPYVLHQAHVLSDEVLFLEQQQDGFVPEVTFSAQEFELLQSTIT